MTDFNYQYPDGLSLSPESDMHKRLVGKIQELTTMGTEPVMGKKATWDRIDDVLTLYAPVDKKEAEIARITREASLPRKLIVPYSLAVLDTSLAFLMSVFLSDSNIFRYSAVNRDDVVGAAQLQHVVNLQLRRNRAQLALYFQFRDALAYGLGVTVPFYMSPEVKKPKQNLFIADPLDNKPGSEDFTYRGRTGLSLANVDLRAAFIDPTVPVHALHQGEFFGWYETANVLRLLGQEQTDASLFNIRHVRASKNTYTGWHHVRRYKKALTAWRNPEACEIVKIYLRLIPKEWKLGNSDFPEIWYFELANNSIIVRAMPIRYTKDLPISVLAPEADGYSNTAVSRMETIQGLQEFQNFLLESHRRAVRDHLRNRMVVDPSKINMMDLANGRPFVRLRRSYWGQGVQNSYEQLKVVDVTRSHIADIGAVFQMMQSLTGIDAFAMGSLRKSGPERLTTAEYTGTQRGAAGRLERLVSVMEWQGLYDMAVLAGKIVQENFNEPLWIDLSADFATSLRETLGEEAPPDDWFAVSPENLRLPWEVDITTRPMPGLSNTDALEQLFKLVAKDEELRAQYSLPKMLEFLMTEYGLKTLKQFKIQVVPDGEVMNGVRSGAVRPVLPGAGNAGGVQGMDVS